MVRQDLPVSIRLLTHARDYLYQDRVGPLLVDTARNAAAARIKGYQDTYVATARDTDAGLIITCSCMAPRLCAHAVALLLVRQEDPDAFFDVTRVRVPVRTPAWWPWMAGDAFNWKTVPDRATGYMRPRSARPPAQVGDEPWAAQAPAQQHEDLLNQLALVHPSWWACAEFLSHYHAIWQQSGLVTRALKHFPAWIDLAWRGPEIPLSPLWEKAPAQIRQSTHTIQQRLWQSDPADDSPLTRLRVLTMLKLLEIGFDQAAQHAKLQDLREGFAWADPGGIERAKFLQRTGQTRDAVRLLERYLPAERSLRSPYRSLLIAWTEGSERLAHQVADILENPSRAKRQALLQSLSPLAADELLRQFPGLKSDAPDSPSE